MKRFHMNYDKSTCTYVQKHRPIVQPNDGFRNQLIILERNRMVQEQKTKGDYTEALFDQQGQKIKEFLIKETK